MGGFCFRCNQPAVRSPNSGKFVILGVGGLIVGGKPALVSLLLELEAARTFRVSGS